MKKTALKIAALLLALSMLMLVGCGGKDAETGLSSGSAVSKKPVSKVSSKETSSGPIMPEVNDYSRLTFNVAEVTDYLKLVGRCATTKTGFEAGSKPCITFDHTAESVEFNADCEGDVVLTLSLKCTNGATEHYFLVSVDGKETRMSADGRLNMEYKTELKLASGLKRGVHNIRVVRETELNFGTENLISVTLSGVLTERPADKKLYIEFFGDSITAGYGNLTKKEDEDNPSYPAKSDGTQTYAYLTAKALDADISTVARSGLAYSYGLGQPIDDYWYKISWARTNLGDYKPARQPDIVVISLGTNDHGNYMYNGLNREDMTPKAVELLQMVRKERPEAKIVWLYGMMGTNIESDIKAAVQQVGGEAKGFYYFRGEGGYNGGGWHPNAAEHTNAANKLTEYLKGIIE